MATVQLAWRVQGVRRCNCGGEGEIALFRDSGTSDVWLECTNCGSTGKSGIALPEDPWSGASMAARLWNEMDLREEDEEETRMLSPEDIDEIYPGYGRSTLMDRYEEEKAQRRAKGRSGMVVIASFMFIVITGVYLLEKNVMEIAARQKTECEQRGGEFVHGRDFSLCLEKGAVLK